MEIMTDAGRLVEKPPVEKERISVAVWWPMEQSYGGATDCASMDEAKKEVEKLVRLGYGKLGKAPIHIVKTATVISRIEWEPTPCTRRHSSI
jgi:hypothetical protein